MTTGARIGAEREAMAKGERARGAEYRNSLYRELASNLKSRIAPDIQIPNLETTLREAFPDLDEPFFGHPDFCNGVATEQEIEAHWVTTLARLWSEYGRERNIGNGAHTPPEWLKPELRQQIRTWYLERGRELSEGDVTEIACNIRRLGAVLQEARRT